MLRMRNSFTENHANSGTRDSLRNLGTLRSCEKAFHDAVGAVISQARTVATARSSQPLDFLLGPVKLVVDVFVVAASVAKYLHGHD